MVATNGHNFASLDVAERKSPSEKANGLQETAVIPVSQSKQLMNPDARVSFELFEGLQLLSSFASNHQGLSTGDNPRFRRVFWEVPEFGKVWEGEQSTVETTQFYGGRNGILRWEGGRGELWRFGRENVETLHNVDRRGEEAWNKCGVAVSQMGELPVTLFCGEKYDTNAAVLIPKNEKHLLALWAYCSSPEFNAKVRTVDQKLNVTNATLVKVPFDLAHWQRVSAEKYPNGLPEPASNDPTQWLFAGHPVDSTAPFQVGVARLLGYRWPRQTGQTVSGAPPVPEDGLEKLVDEDGIVCIPSVRGEAPAAERLRALLATAYGKAWSPAKLDELLSALDYAGSNLEDWLRNGFFDQHSKLFHHRPFIWQIWDGRKDGFSALVNYHMLDHKLLEKLTYTYLGDWIKKQQEAVANGEGGADDRLVKAQQLQDRLKLILEGEAPYDIFVRWKPLEQQPIGWHPDLNDGVRLNIRPFMEAAVLRKRPNIKWGKDRGKNPPGSPWGEERDNDRHLTLAEKQRARGPSLPSPVDS